MSKPSWIKPHLAARLLESAAAQTNKSQGATYSDPNIELVRGIPVGYHVDPNAPKGDPNAALKQELRRIMEGIGLPTLPANSSAPLTRGEQELLKDIKEVTGTTSISGSAGGSASSTSGSASGAVTSVRTSSGLVLKVGDKVRNKRWYDKTFYPITRFDSAGRYFYVAFANGAELKSPYAINNSGWEIEPRAEAWDPMTEPLQVGDKVEVVFEDERYKGKVGTVKYSGTSGTSVFDSNGQPIGAGYWSFRSSLKLIAKAGTF